MGGFKDLRKALHNLILKMQRAGAKMKMVPRLEVPNDRASFHMSPMRGFLERSGFGYWAGQAWKPSKNELPLSKSSIITEFAHSLGIQLCRNHDHDHRPHTLCFSPLESRQAVTLVYSRSLGN